MGFGSKLRHKVGIRPPREMTYEENQEMMDDLGIMRKKNPNEVRNKEKFAAYGAMAKDLANKKDQELVPEGYEEYAVNGATPYVYNRHAAVPDDYNQTPGKKNKDLEAVPAVSYDPYNSRVSKKFNYSQSTQAENSDNYNPYNSSSCNTGYGSTQGNNPYESETNAFGSNNNPYSSDDNPYSSQNNNYNTLVKKDSYNDNNPYSANNNKYASSNNNSFNGNTPANNAVPKEHFNQNLNTSLPYTSSRINPNRNLRESQTKYIADEDTFNFEEGAGSGSLQRASTNTTDFNSAPKENIKSRINNNYSTLPEYDEDDDLNASIHEEDQINPYGENQTQVYQPQQPIYEDEEYDTFNNEPENQATHYTTFEEMQRQQQEQQQREEDEEVDTIKQQIKFTKQSSAASTRNTLKMARDAEMAGLNTLGMLGSQSEKLGNIENNLTLLKIQNREADSRVSELKKLNRSVFAVHVSNPFTSKRRAKEMEERIKTQREMDKEMQNETRQKLFDSTNSVTHAMNSVNDQRLGRTPQHGADSIREKYSRDQILKRNKKYAFEGDDEDEDLEVEIDRNLNEISNVSKRLKNIAMSQNQEVNKQQNRLNDIEGDTDDLDIKLYWNTKRLQNIK